MAGTASIGGLVSGLKTDEIIAKMVEYAKRPIALLEARQTGYSAKLAAWQETNKRLLALKTKAADLAFPVNFRAKSVTVSDESLLLSLIHI